MDTSINCEHKTMWVLVALALAPTGIKSNSPSDMVTFPLAAYASEKQCIAAESAIERAIKNGVDPRHAEKPRILCTKGDSWMGME